MINLREITDTDSGCLIVKSKSVHFSTKVEQIQILAV